MYMYIAYLDLLQKFEELRSQGESIDAIGAIMLEWVSAAQLAYCHALIQYMYCSSPDLHIPILCTDIGTIFIQAYAWSMKHY